ncbi:MAG: hypothetical protein CMB47_05780 [Euryarchaeota archaeon]|nr:hypothetical protein [Euryarchaeota archaeon]|tara:strand:+ start:627 stop:1196 length:570 start_codon:yes stop_codon:yes gene_type:complete
MIDLKDRNVHLSYEQGSGGTSLCLTIAKSYLKNGNKVIWLSKYLPDRERTAQIFSELKNKELEKISFIEIENNLEDSSKILKYLSLNMNDQDLIIIDDWCAKDGRADKKDIEALKNIIFDYDNIKILVSSASYSNVVSDAQRWGSKGGSKVRDILDTIFLYRISEMDNVRILKDGEDIKKISLIETGFE